MDDEKRTILIQQQLDAVGNLADPRLMLTLADDVEGVHARNLDHLHAYVRARRLHQQEPACGAGPICSGLGVSTALVARDEMNEGYISSVALSAIALLGDVMAERDELAARVMRLEMEHDEQDQLRRRAEELLAASGREVAELTERVAACEALVADVRAGWPQT